VASTQQWSRVLAVASAAALTSLFAIGSAKAESQLEADQEGAEKISHAVMEQIQEEGEAEYWVRFEGAPDYSDAHNADSKDEKGAAAVEAAQEFAEASQAEVNAFLDEAGVAYESYWGSSTIGLTGGADLAARIAEFDGVAAVVEAPAYELIEPVETDVAPMATTWGVDNINAPDVWDMGIDGSGITIGSIDTGVDYSHPALVEQYRGNNGDGTFTHDYNFRDVQDACGDEPCDDHGHGTHTMGTMVGDDGDEAQIGVAPGAEWIAVNGCCPNLGALLESGEWIAAPTDSEGNNPDPSKAPEIVNNSWGTTLPIDDPFYQDIVDLWHASGIIPVFALGNSGPACNTSASPGVYPDVIGVGAHDIQNQIASFSARGPGRDGQIKPDVTAPGVAVVSSLPGGTYGAGSGTSMAAPHVAGTIALMMAAEPDLIGDYDAVYEALTLSSIPVADSQCGGSSKLNNVYGHGRIDAFAAVMDATESSDAVVSTGAHTPSLVDVLLGR
jgi:subtilisin family serine protease